ncbi:MAG: Ig-like domain-containing protein [Chitinophagaceae bacterium]
MKNLYLFTILSFFCRNILAQSFPDQNFSVSTIVSGLTEPVGAAFSKDGEKLFVWEKAGFVYVCNKSGASYVKQTTPVIDLTAEVLNWRDHGLMGFALDPDFATNGYIYLLYIVDRRFLMNNNSIAVDEGHQATIARLTKYKIVTSGGNLVVDPSTRTILIGESPSTGIAVVHESHVIGSLAFAADGTLLVSTGDGASYYLMDAGSDSDTYWDQAITDGIIRPVENVGAFRAQILNCHNGKLLRIDPNTGNGVSSNPYYSAAAPRTAKSRVWAMGFRNPFRILIRPGTGSTNPAAGDIGEVYAGDVGWSTWEEFSIITGPGMNCGWPVYEGHEINSQYNTKAATLQNMDEPNPLAGQSGCTRPYFTFRELIKDPTADENKTIYNPCNNSVAIGTGPRYVHRRPAIDFKHEVASSRVGIFTGNTAALAEIGTPASGVVGTPFAGNCSLAGVWYTGDNFPPDYKNTFLLVDETARWIKRFTIDYTDVITRVSDLVMVFANITSLAENPIDGTLAAVDITTNSVKKIQYGGNQPPVAVPKANVIYGTSPLTVNFTGNTSYDLSPGGSIASYSWNFGGGTPATSTAANPAGIVFTNAAGAKKFVVKLTVTDNGGATDIDSVIISVNNTPPFVNITSPVKNSTYPLGGDAVYNCTATVTDNEHTAAQLKYEWQTILRHNNHEHPEAIDNNVSTTTRISRIGCNGDTYYWLVKLKVTDAAGLSGFDSSKIYPDCGSDNIPPVVTAITPANGATSVSVSTAVSSNFSEAIDASTVNGVTFQLKNAGNNIITALVSTSSNQITLTPSSALPGSAVYTATIKGGSSGVKDLAGNALAGDYSWSFTTVAVDNIPPTITSVLPVTGTTGISTGTTVTANFSEAINPSTVTGNTFQLRDAGSSLVSATLNASGSQITLTPSAILAGSTVYNATITGGSTGVKDLAGNALVNNYSWSFTTAAVDITAPTITSVSPVNGATGVSTGTTVIANFSEAINASSVTTSAFQLRNSANTLITGAVSTSGNQIILTPSSALAGSTVYTATFTGGTSGVKDLSGNALVSNYSWSFTTAATTSASPVSIQSFNPKTGTAPTVHSLTAVPAGALLVLSTTADAVVSNCIVTSTPSLTWTKQVDAGATNSDNAEIWTAVYTAGGSITVTSNWGAGNSQASVCYIVLNAEPTLGGAFGTATLQASPSVTITTTRDNSIIFGCTADWKSINGATRTLRDGATEALYFKDGNYATYHYTKAAATIAAYSEGVSLPAGQQASTSVLEIRGAAAATSSPLAVTTQPASQTRCAGANASFSSAASGTPTPTVQWQQSTNGTTWTNITGATSATLSFATSTADNNKQYRAVWTNSGGPVNSNPAILTVNPIPVLSGSLTATAASGTAFSYTPTSVTTGTVFTWTRAAVTGISNTAGSGTGAINETLVNTTTSAINVTYVYTLTANSCTNIQSVVVTVNTGIVSPIVTTQPVSLTKCAGANASFISAASGTPTPTVQWQESTNGTTWTNITGATSATLSFATSTADNNKQYRAVWTNSGGPVNSNPAVLTVNPIPVLSSNLTATSISGTSFIYTATSFTTGTAFAWSRAGVMGISNASANGIGNINETLVNTTTSPVNVIYVYSLTANSCTNTQDVIVTVNAEEEIPSPPTVTAQPSLQTKCAGANASFTSAASGTPTPTVQWQESTDGTSWSNITGATSATLLFVTAIADNNKQYRAVWTNSEGTINSDPAVLTVNAIPFAPEVSVVDNCGNSVLTAGFYSGSLLWSTGATDEAITVTTIGTYSVRQTVNNCTSPAGDGLAAPKPIPALSGSLTSTAISGTAFVYTPTSSATGTIFNWTRANVSGIENAAANGNDNINETLINTTTSPVNVIYVYTLTANSCTNTQNVVVTVNTGIVSPTVTTQPASQTKCAGLNASFTSAASGTPTPTIQWQESTNGTSWTNITGATSSTLSFATSTADNNKQYRAVWTNSGSSVNSNPAVLTVNPIPVLSSNLTASATSGTAFSYTPTSVTTGTVFTWTRAAVTGISNGSANGTGNINETLINTTTSAVNVTYVYILTANSCTNIQNVVVTVNTGIVSPTVTTQPASQTRCAGANAIFTSAASGSPAPTVQWQQSTNGTSWTNITGATGSTLSFATSTADNNKQYRAVWTNSGSSVNSNPAVLTVNPIPVLSSNLTASATSGTAFSYTPTSVTTGTVFTWTRAVVTGISNTAGSATGAINETLVNTTASAVNVTYMYTLTANGCANTQNLVVTVNPAATVNCVINGSITSSFNSTAIPAGRYIWFNSSFNPGGLGSGTATVTFNVSNSKITFTANSQVYTLNVPNSRIRFDNTVSSATTQFINNVWETVVPRSYTNYVFMGGLSYLVPVSLPGSITNVKWTADISIDRTGRSLTWRWSAATYTSFAAHAGLNIKPINSSTQNPYQNSDNAGTPENFKPNVVAGAKGSGGTNYTGTYSSTSTATCVVTALQRSSPHTPTTLQSSGKQIPELFVEDFSKEKLQVNVMPNPSYTYFNLVIRSNNSNPVQVRVIDITGREIEIHENIAGNVVLRIGHRWASGPYFVEVIQADQRRFVKIIKVN